MARVLRRMGVGVVALTLTLVTGGIASAVPPSCTTSTSSVTGDNPANVCVDVKYQIASFRGIELSSSSAIAFGTVRQGSFKSVTGPTIYYATSWTGDDVYAYLDGDMTDNVTLSVTMGTATKPSNTSMQCVAQGTAASPVDLSNSWTFGPYSLITGITDCGFPTYSGGGSPVPADWATASTSFTLDATNASQGGTLTDSKTKVLTFVIGQW